jgi:uncharacterized small protein (DUF1192 family)
MDNLMHPDLVAEFIKEFHAEVNRRRHPAELSFALKQRELDELEQRKAALEAEIANAPAPAPRLHPNLAELYREKVANL